MYRIYIFILLSISWNASAHTITVEYGFSKFILEMREHELRFQQKEHTATVIHQDCNSKLFEDFRSRFSLLLKDPPANHRSGAEFQVKYRIDDRDGILNTSHPFSQTLLSIPKQFDILKLASIYRCKKRI